MGESQFGAQGKDRKLARGTGTRRAPCVFVSSFAFL